MYAKITGTCVHASPPREINIPGKPKRVVHEFGFLISTPKNMPEVIKVVSFNGFAPKMQESITFDARITTRVWQNQAQLSVEVL